MCFLHGVGRWILACAYDQPGADGPAGNHERIVLTGTSSYKMDDFQLVAVSEGDVFPLQFRNNRSVSLDSNAVSGQIEVLEKLKQL